jgi:hypothetical protein
LQPEECVACTDAHGGCAAEERPVEEWFDAAAKRAVAVRQQAEAFDGGAADNVALVFSELPKNFGSEANLLRSAGGAGDDEAEVPTCACFSDGYFGEDGCQLGGVGSERFAIPLGDAASHVGSADM